MKKGYINYKLKAAIAERGLRQEDIARAINITTSTLSRKLNGKLIFDEIEILGISNFLDKRIMDIFFTQKLPIE